MNLSNSTYLDDGFERISNLLVQFISGRLNIFGADQSLILFLNNLCKQLRNDSNPQRYRILLQKRFDKVLVYILEISFRRRNKELLKSTLDLLIITTNNSKEFVMALMTTDSPKLLIDYMLVLVDKKNCITNLDVVTSCLIVIFNIIRYKPNRKCFHSHLRISKFKEVLNSILIMNAEKYTKVLAYILFGFLSINVSDISVISKHFDIIEDVYDYLSNALKSLDRTYQGYNIWELLVGLEALCYIDEIRKKIIAINGFIATIITIATSNSSKPDEVTVALEILQNLCIDVNTQTMLINQYQVDRVIVPLTNSDVDNIKINAEQLLANLKKLDQNNNDCNEYDALISFSESDMDIIKKVVMSLKGEFKIGCLRSGYKNFKSAFNKSNILILGLSISYQEDVTCIDQVVYAHQIGKKIIPLMLVHKIRIRKELQHIIDSNNCIDFSDCTMFNEAMAKVFQLLCNGRTMDNTVTKVQSSEEISFQLPEQMMSNNIERIKESNESKSWEDTEPCSSVRQVIKELNKLECTPSITTYTTKSKSAFEVTKSTESKSSNESEVHSKDSSYINSQKCLKTEFENWSKDQVSEWLTANNLSEVHNKFNSIDGSMLKAIMNMRNKTAQTYYNKLETSMGLEFFEILKFDIALERIENHTDE